ncbi:TetR/AcrR family transcriptional regulator [Hydrogenophaga sp.]|uniref:TetR/AcrR family transcriptional regulator n=1 Tax=Hydrogenophaga sp. TaxID=1904254 RepID=UPI003F6EA5F2
MNASKVGRPASNKSGSDAGERGGPFDKESEHARKSHAILLAAAKAFVQAGFHNTSLQHIANRLGISKPTLCYYVGSKEEILFKCQHTALEHLKLTIPQANDPSRTGMEQLGDFILNLAEWTASDFARCLVRCQWDVLDEEALTHLATERQLIDSALQQIVSRGLADGSIRDVHPALASAAILGSLNWIATWFDPDRTHRSSREIGEAFLDLFMNGLKTATRPQAGAKVKMAVIPGGGTGKNAR